MTIVLRSPVADADLVDIFEYIARDNPEAARGLVRKICECAKQHADSPMIGTPCPELEEGIRSFVVGSYVAFYLPLNNGVYLLRVLHSARDIPNAFFGTLPNS